MLPILPCTLQNTLEININFNVMLDEWKEMKAAGILDKLGEEPDEGMIIEMDSMSKRLLRKQRGVSKEKEAANKAVAASLRLAGEDYEEEKKEGPSQEQMLREFREKLLTVGATKEGSSLGVYSLLNEVKDKSKLNSNSNIIASLIS